MSRSPEIQAKKKWNTENTINTQTLSTFWCSKNSQSIKAHLFCYDTCHTSCFFTLSLKSCMCKISSYQAIVFFRELEQKCRSLIKRDPSVARLVISENWGSSSNYRGSRASCWGYLLMDSAIDQGLVFLSNALIRFRSYLRYIFGSSRQSLKSYLKLGYCNGKKRQLGWVVQQPHN